MVNKEVLNKFRFIYSKQELESVKELDSISSESEKRVRIPKRTSSLKELTINSSPVKPKLPKIRLSKIENPNVEVFGKEDSLESYNIFVSRTQSKISKNQKKKPEITENLKSIRKFNEENYRKAISLVRNKRRSSFSVIKKQNTLIPTKSSKLSCFKFDENSLQQLKKLPSALKIIDFSNFTNRFSIKKQIASRKTFKIKTRESKEVDMQKYIKTLEKYKKENAILRAENNQFREETKLIKEKLNLLHLTIMDFSKNLPSPKI